MATNDIMFSLGENEIFCAVSKFNENHYVAFRKYKTYLGNVRRYPTREGVSFTVPQYLMFLETTKRISTDLRKALDGRNSLPVGQLWTKEVGDGKFVSLSVIENNGVKMFIIKIENIESPEKCVTLTVDMYYEFLRVRDEVARHIEIE